MSIGPDIKEVLKEVGTAYTIIRTAGNVTGEYLDYELNAQVTKPFIQEFFLDAVLSHDTVAVTGDVLEFNLSGNRYLLMNKTPEAFENTIISYAVVLYKSNVNIEVFRPSERDWHRHHFQKITVWTSIGSIDVLITSPLFGNALDTDEELGLIGLQRREMYIPSSLGARVLDRVWIDSSEYYRVESVMKRRYSGVDVLELGNDTRPLTVTTTSTTSSTISTTSTTSSTTSTTSSTISTTSSTLSTSSTSSSSSSTTSTAEVLGPELVTDGGFDAVTEGSELISNGTDFTGGPPPTGWSASGSTLAAVAGGQAGNCLEITRTGGTVQSAVQTITTLTAGKAYRLSVYIKSGTSGNEQYVLYINQIGVGPVQSKSGTSSAEWVEAVINFISAGTEDQILIYKNTATAGTMLFDTISLKEITFTNWTAGTGWAPQATAGSLTGKAQKVAGTASNLEQTTVVPLSSQIYRIIYTFGKLAGDAGDGITVELGSTDGTLRTSSGTYDEDITTTDTDHLKFKQTDSDADLAVTIDVVSVRKVN